MKYSMNPIEMEKEMRKGIKDAGGLFYQYRSCNMDKSTIYDVENLRHGVVYARTPLLMNDPYDSRIGFSSQKIYDECIQMFIDAIPDQDGTTKLLMAYILQQKKAGKMAEFIVTMKEIDKHIRLKRANAKQQNIPLDQYVLLNANNLYKKTPRPLRDKLTLQVFTVIACLTASTKMDVMTEETIEDMFQLDDKLDELNKVIHDIEHGIYKEQIDTLLSQMTISCFSASGWDNQLMWAHYGNSYKGICVEYEFSKIDDFGKVGFVLPAEYSSNRPTLSLKDIGIKGIDFAKDDKVVRDTSGDFSNMFHCLLAKNECWEYENEWRILNIGEPDTPIQIDFPHVKSITFGIGIDPICRHMLFDVCEDRGISCYQIELANDKYELNRYPLTREDFTYDVALDQELVEKFAKKIKEFAKEIQAYVGKEFWHDGKVDTRMANKVLSMIADVITQTYFFKFSVNRAAAYDVEASPDVVAPDNLIEIIMQVETMLEQASGCAANIETMGRNAKIMGLIDLAAWREIRKNTTAIHDLIHKYYDRPWHPVIASGLTRMHGEETED